LIRKFASHDKREALRFLNFNVHIINRMYANKRKILNLISKCREMRDVSKKTKLLEHINQILPAESRIRLPSLITGDGIDNLLSWIEVKISPPIYGLATP
jgi:hypothetical protein